MADKFVRLGTVEKPEYEQMRIYATLRCYSMLSEREQRYIRELCREVGGEWGAVLFRFLTGRESFTATVLREHIPEGKLRQMRGEVYRRWEL